MTLPLIALIICGAIGFIILATNYLKLHPFLALILSCLLVGFATGMDSLVLVKTISSGFGAILSGIGLIVVLGTVIGVFIEKSGALDSITDFVLQLLGSNRTTTAMGLLGAIVSIPVFCDSAFVILSKLSHTLASKQGKSSASMSLALATGLYTSHTLIPPTPGPIAVAGNLGAANHLGVIILVGIVISIPVLIVCIWLSNRFGGKIQIHLDNEQTPSAYEERMNILWAATPILVPILLIAGSSIFSLLEVDLSIVSFLGQPIIALIIGSLLAMIQALPKIKFRDQSELFGSGVVQAGPIILITGAGGAFGAVLKATPLTELLSNQFAGGQMSFGLLLVLAFGIAALLKTAQGSSTSALVIGSAILAPFVSDMGIESPLELALLVSSFGAGAMVVSHANDSYFWVVTQMSGFSMKQGYRSYTLITLAQGITAIATVFILYLIFV